MGNLGRGSLRAQSLADRSIHWQALPINKNQAYLCRKRSPRVPNYAAGRILWFRVSGMGSEDGAGSAQSAASQAAVTSLRTWRCWVVGQLRVNIGFMVDQLHRCPSVNMKLTHYPAMRSSPRSSTNVYAIWGCRCSKLLCEVPKPMPCVSGSWGRSGVNAWTF